MVEKMRIGVVGCGNIGKVHAKAIKNLKDAELAAVSDQWRTNSESVAHEFGCAWYTDHREMMAKENLDILTVCTPSGTRLDICRAAADARVNLLIEKPLDITMKHTSQIIELAQEAGIKLGTVFQLRFMPLYSGLKKAATDGRFGRLIMGNAATICFRSKDYYLSGGWRGTRALDGGGALMNQGIHTVDLLLWIMGDVKSVFAYAGNLTHDIEVEDTVTAAVEFKNGAVGTIQATTSVYHGINKKLEIYGTDGSAIILDEDPLLWQFREDREDDSSFLHGHAPVSAISPIVEDTWAHEQAILDMMGAIAEDRQPFVSGMEGEKATELVLAIYKSAETGKRVDLPLARE